MPLGSVVPAGKLRWIAAMKARPSWAAANVGFEAWRDATLAKRVA